MTIDRRAWIRTDPHRDIDVGRRVRAGAARGAVAGAVGVGVMTLGELVEQRVTHRPSSFMPAHTLARLLGRPAGSAERNAELNAAMHVGQAVLLGMWRGLMAEGGLRGVPASAAFTVIRLSTDQTLENITGQGAPPWTWPRRELVVDVLHKAVYAFVTGAVADRLATDPPAWRAARRR